MLLHGDGFGEIAGLVHIAPALDGDVVAEELERNGGDDRQDRLVAFGNGDDVVGDAGGEFRAFGGDDDGFSAARLDLLDGGDEFAEYLVFWREENRRTFRADQGDGAVFHFRCRVGLSVNVGNFLELERALQSDGEEGKPPEEKHVIIVRVAPGDVVDVRCLRQHFSHQIGDGFERLYILHPVVKAHVAHPCRVEGDDGADE